MKTIRYFLLIILIYGLLVWGGRNTVVASTAFLVQMVSVICILYFDKKYGKAKVLQMIDEWKPSVIIVGCAAVLSFAVLIICCLIWLIQAMSV